MGIYTVVWQRGVQEVFAESLVWLYGDRCLTHPGFGDAFGECVTIVEREVEALRETP